MLTFDLSTAIACTFILLQLSMVSSFDFHAHQFILSHSNNATIGYGVIETFPTSLPATYDSSFRREIVLMGYCLDMMNVYDVEINLQPYAADSTATIQVETGTATYLYKMSVQIVFVNLTSTWVQVTQGSRSASQYFDVTLNGPYNVSLTYENRTFLQSINYASTMERTVSCKLDGLWFSSGTTMQIRLWTPHGPGTTIYSGSVCVVIMAVQLYPSHGVSRFIGQKWYGTGWGKITAGDIFGIPAVDPVTTPTSYDDRCLIGFGMWMQVAGRTTAFKYHSFMFDIRAHPFSDVQNIIPGGEQFFVYWHIVCLWQCPLPYGLDPSTGRCANCTDIALGLHDLVGTCVECSDEGCLVCPIYNDCVQCKPDLYIEPYCYSCQTVTVSCLTCINASYCTSCVNNTYYLDSNHFCSLCSSVLNDCKTCTNGSHCLACQTSSHFVNATSNQCQLCSTALANCSSCLNSSFCVTCFSDYYGYNNTLGICVLCSNIFAQCLRCTTLQCLQCQQGLIPINAGQKCQCFLGMLINGTCTTLAGCLQPYLDATNTQRCMTCNSSLYYPTPVNDACVCLKGTLINSICSTVYGCISPILLPDGTDSCRACSMALRFKNTPGPDGQCLCLDGYQRQVDTCVDICGDGMLMNRTYMKFCDDGNLDNGDGCSSQCLTQNGYKCSGGSPSSASICIYQGSPIKLELSNVQKTDGMNQAVFNFAVSPSIDNLKNMNYSKYLNFSCVDSDYTVSEIKYSGGNLVVTVDYNDDLQKSKCTTILSFDTNIAKSPTFTLNFDAISDGVPLNYFTSYQQYRTFAFICEIVSYCILGIYALSLVHKMIGAELVFSMQMVYLSYSLYKKPTFFSGSLKSSGVVSGYWAMFYDQERDMNRLLPFSSRVQMAPSFLQSSFCVVAALIFVGTLLLGTIIASNILKPSSKEAVKKVRNTCQWGQKLRKILYSSFLFPLVAAFSCVLMISSYYAILNLGTAASSDSTFSAYLNAFGQSLTWLILGTVFGMQIYWKEPVQLTALTGLKGLKGACFWYIPLFLLRGVAVSLLFQLGISLSFDVVIYPLLLFSTFYFVALLKLKPYQKRIDNLGCFLCQFTIIFAVVLPLLNHFISLNQQIQSVILFILLGFTMVSMLVALIRILLAYKQALYQYHFQKLSEQNQENFQRQNLKLNQQNQQIAHFFQAQHLNHQATILQFNNQGLIARTADTQKRNNRFYRALDNLQRRNSRVRLLKETGEEEEEEGEEEKEKEKEEDIELRKNKEKLKESLMLSKLKKQKEKLSSSMIR